MTLPSPQHKFVRGDGSTLEYVADSTCPCPSCNPDSSDPERRLAVIAFVDSTVLLECIHCGHDVRMMKGQFLRYEIPKEA